MEKFSFTRVRGHIEVYDLDGKFCFSADNMREAEQEALDYLACILKR